MISNVAKMKNHFDYKLLQIIELEYKGKDSLFCYVKTDYTLFRININFSDGINTV